MAQGAPEELKHGHTHTAVALREYEQALGLDDVLIKRTIIEWGPVIKGGRVNVMIREMRTRNRALVGAEAEG